MFQMDGRGNFFDEECLNSVAGDPKDYIAIPFAEGVGEGPHSLFCGNILHRETVSCKCGYCMLNYEMTYIDWM